MESCKILWQVLSIAPIAEMPCSAALISKQDNLHPLSAPLISVRRFLPPLYMVEGKILEALSLWMKQHEPTWEEESSADVFSTKIMALEHAIADMEQELQGLQSQFEKIFEFLETGIYTPEVFTARNKTLSEKMAEIRSAIEETQAELSKLKSSKKKSSFHDS